MDVSLSELRELVIDREAWHAVIHGVAKSWTQLSNWTEVNWDVLFLDPGAGYVGMFVLWQSTELYTYDWSNFLYICVLSCNKIYKKYHNSSFLPPYTPQIIKF